MPRETPWLSPDHVSLSTATELIVSLFLQPYFLFLEQQHKMAITPKGCTCVRNESDGASNLKCKGNLPFPALQPNKTQ